MIAIGYMGALLVGVVLGLLGSGGSILAVPILVYFFSMPASMATTYSLFTVGLTSVVGAISFLRENEIDVRSGLIFLIPSLIGVLVARRFLLPVIPNSVLSVSAWVLTKDRLLLLATSVAMVAVSISMLRRSAGPTAVTPPAASHRIFISGLFAGTIMGFLGTGGGFLIVPTLVTLIRMPMRAAIGTSLVIIAVTALSGFASDLQTLKDVDWRFLFAFSGLSVAGVLLGTRVARHARPARLKQAFGIALLVLGIGIALLETMLR